MSFVTRWRLPAPGFTPRWRGPEGVLAAVTASSAETPLSAFVVPASPAGPKGDDGDAGAAGPQGDPGNDGADGAPGAPGADGSDGADGASAYELALVNGFVGSQAAWLASLVGAKGDKGDPGDPGNDGADGAPGTPGADGADGSDGADGASAYAAALLNGFVGSEAAWLASLVGAKGDKGDPGDDGADGAPGADGADGAPGADGADFDPAIVAEIAEARGDRSTLGLRIAAISNFASPNAGGTIIGQYYDNAFQGTASSTLAGAANRIDLAPFFTSQPLRIDQIGVAVSTAVASALGRICIYEADADGWPGALVFEGASNLDFGTTGYKFHTLDFTFDNGRQYWIGVIQSSTATLRTINVSSAVNLGINGSAGTIYFTILRRTLTFANPLPDPWDFVSGDRVANVTPPSIRMRAAALP